MSILRIVAYARVALAASLCGAVTACGGSSGKTKPPASYFARQQPVGGVHCRSGSFLLSHGVQRCVGDARLAGRVRLCGGPRNGCFTEKTWVFVTDHDHLVAASIIRDGRFSFDLEPGRYTVRARAGGGLLGQRSVDAVADKTIRVSIVYPVK
jgi:hypothetical protein